MGVCTILADSTTILGEFATCTQYNNEYLNCDNYKNDDDAYVCKFNYYIFGDGARFVGELGARM